MSPEGSGPPAGPRRVALGVLGRRYVEFDVLMQWVHILRERYWPGPTFVGRDLYPAEGRNVVTEGALGREDWDDFLWVDSDHLPGPRFMDRLAELPLDAEVIGGLYFGREYPFDLQAWTSDPEREGLRQIHPAEIARMLALPALYRVGGVGTGWMLIRRPVLERLRELRGAGNVWEVRGLSAELAAQVGVGLVLGEDVTFCINVRRELGVQVWLDTDPRQESAHVGTARYTRREWEAAHLVPAGAPQVDLGALERSGHRLEVAGNRAHRRAAARGRGSS